MFVQTEYKLPGYLITFKKPEDCSNDGWAELDIIPRGLVTLAEADWPEWVKIRIEFFYRLIGVEKPLQQKLVEPGAIYFEGEKEDGKYKLENVNWQKMIDYFEFESASLAASMTDDQTEQLAKERFAKYLQDRAKERYGHGFMHYYIYDPSGGYC